MPVTPVVLNVATRWGASAVPEPCSATTGSVIRNSATPPAVNVSGFVWLAFTSTTALPSASTVSGLTPVAVVMLSPR